MLQERGARWIGAAFLLQFVVVCAIKAHKELAWEILWMSHASLLLAAIGLLTRSMVLVGTAYVAIFSLHTLWLIDCFTWMITGHSPLAITAYLASADPWVWVATSHHFYLAPILATLVYRARTLPRESLLGAVAMYLLLTVVCRALSTSTLNVNYAHGVLSQLRLGVVDWLNLLPGTAYLLMLNLGVTVLFFLPAFFGIRLLIARRTARTV